MSWFVFVIGKPEVRGFDGGCRAHISILLGMLWALKGQRGRTGAWVSANLVGRWLTSPCPSKCDLGHTFNEIHSTWQAPPLPGMSVWSPALFQSFYWVHVLLLCICCVCLCVCVLCVLECFKKKKGSDAETSNKNWMNMSKSTAACQPASVRHRLSRST